MRYRYRDDSEMKDSGVEWIGKIPKDWEIIQLKYLLKNKITDGPHETPTFTNEGIPFLSVDSIKDGKLIFKNSRYISYYDHQKYIKKCRPQRNDILMGKAASTGKIAMVETDIEFSIWSPLALIRANNNIIKSKYLEFSMKSSQVQYQIEILCTNNTQKNISMDDISKLKIVYPDINRQEKIANFLDEKTSKFDSLISKKEALIEKLEEAKKSLISEVVTGKVKVVRNDDGYELVKRSSDEMRDSGIEWLGHVPKDWVLIKSARIANIVRGASPRPAGDPLYFGGNNVPWITVGEITKDDNKILDSVSSYLTKLGKQQSRYLEKGTLVLSNSGATLGVPKILGIEGCINDGSLAFLNLNINKNYLYYLLKSRTEIFRKEMQISGQPNLNTDVVKSLHILKPNDLEQKIISEALDIKNIEINYLVRNIKLQIEKIKQVKQSLISEAVTGKIEILD